ncbi:MAG TPA: PEP-CTERM sorting domain-containing protein [Verrucomicrobiae bacterium]|nr:PEP-CTERM sorting domain-containing protein [Verrucomicrobiae bacterium]
MSKLPSVLRDVFIVVATFFWASVPGHGAIQFPGSGTNYSYSQNFDSALGAEWTLDGWQTVGIFSGGATQVTATGTGNLLVQPSSPGNFTDTAFGGATFPLPAIKTPDSFTNHGASGLWLINLARSSGSGTGTATLSFTNLPAHTSIDIDFLLAAGDSIDATDYTNITLRVDGATLWQFQFSASGNNLSGPGIVKLVGNGNLDNYYREQWANNTAGPTNANDRFAQSWIGDSFYNMDGFSNFTAIPHTSDTLTIEIIHNLSSAYTDEYLAIENLGVTLNGVIPEPSALSLIGLGVASWAVGHLRRRRN